MEIPQMAVAQYEGKAIVEKMMKAAKKALSSTFKFLMFISPVYPQCSQGLS